MTRIQDYNPNLREITERILLGPQAEIQEKLQRFNERYRTDLGITPTFRWKPGTGNKLKELHSIWCLGQGMKYSGIYQFFRRIDNRNYMHSSMKRLLNEIESSCGILRRDGIRFQDNTDIVIETFNDIKETLVEEMQTAHDMWPHTDLEMNVTIDDSNEEYPEYHQLVIDYTISNPEMNMINNGEIIATLKQYPVNVQFKIDLFKLVNSRAANNASRRGIRNIITQGRYLDPGGLNHPYIPQRYGHQTENHFTTVCLGSFGGDVLNSVSALNLVGTGIHLINWLSTYDMQLTRPHNQPHKSFYGYPKWLKDDLTNKETETAFFSSYSADNNLNQCGVKGALASLDDIQRLNALEMDTTCNDIECEFRGNCNLYKNVFNASEERIDNIMSFGEINRSNMTDPMIALYLHRSMLNSEVQDHVNDSLQSELEEPDREADPEEMAREWMEQTIINNRGRTIR